VYKVYVNKVEYTVASVTGGAVATCKITMSENVAAADAGSMVCGTGAGKDGSAIYCTMVLGADAYGVTEVEGLGLEHIVMQLGSGGTADPLKQRATVGWKATEVCERLVEEFMVRVEHTSKKFRLSAVSN
jgi:N4-gp56 family major capsid protein